MTELSDYKRMVMEPYQNKLKKRIVEQAERITELESALSELATAVRHKRDLLSANIRRVPASQLVLANNDILVALAISETLLATTEDKP